ncbi:MAG: TolC family protein [Bacteroidota bacterium]|nr:TolC family protein [Bacteroidota bacterium]
MKTSFCNILLLFFCLLGISVKAQEPVVLSLDSAINYAIRHNKTLINSRYSVDKSSQKIKEAISSGLPQMNVTMDYTNYLGAEASIQFSELAPPTTFKFNPTSNLQATVSQLLFNGDYYMGIQLSKLAKKLTEQSYLKDESDVKEQTIQAYYIVLANERILNIIKENKANAQTIYEKTTNLANAGILEETDAKKLSIMVTTVDNQIKSTERQLELGYNLLRLQLGLDPGQSIKLASTLDEISQHYILHISPADTFNIENNLDYKLICMQGRLAKKNIDFQKANFLPTLAAYYSYTEKIQKSIFDLSPKNVLGLTLKIPVFSGGQRYSQLKQAKIDYDISENTRKLVSQQLTIQERQMRYNYQNLFEQYLNQKANREIAKEVLEKMNLKYQQGVVSTLELTSANSEYLNAETSFTSVMLQLLNAELALRKTNNKF